MLKSTLQAATMAVIVMFASSASVASAFWSMHWNPVVNTSRGMLLGYDDGQVRTFLGVPYAEPPVGDLRWAPPAPKQAWWFPRTVLNHQPACLQADLISFSLLTSEDCLYLNVWAPSKPGPHPVMVWIHGGGFNSGEGGFGAYDGARLAREQDVVVVTLNYRLSFLGFLSLPGLSHASPHGVSGNQGFYDQLQALRFVKQEIAHFGGDPDNITVFGESAGSISTCLLLSSPLTEGLLHKAIMQSGGCDLRPAISPAQAETEGLTFLSEVLGCHGPDAAQCARSMSTQTLRDRIAPLLAAGLPFLPSPVIDGHLLPDDAIALLEQGNKSHVPVLLGDNADEGSAFVLDRQHADDAAGYRADTARWYPDKDTDQLMALYPLQRYDTAGSADADMMGDKAFVCTTQQVADILSDAGNPVYRYHFSQQVDSLLAWMMPLTSSDPNPPTIGTIHTAELPYVFGNPSIYGIFSTADHFHLRQTMMRYWTRFARTGNPNGGLLPAWPRYDTAGRAFLRLDTPIRTGNNLKRSECAFWLAP